MKKILSLLMAAVTSLALTSCSGNSPASQAESVLQSQTEQLATEEQPSVEQAVTADSAEEIGTSAEETLEAPETSETSERSHDESEPEASSSAPEVTDPYDESEPPQSQPEITTAGKPATEPTTHAPDSGNETGTTGNAIDEDGTYSSRDDVALYIHTFGHLPGNFITKKQARELGWGGGSVVEITSEIMRGCSLISPGAAILNATSTPWERTAGEPSALYFPTTG